MNRNLPVLAGTVVLIACLGGTAFAEERAEHREREPAAPHATAHLKLDQRYQHDHYYPPRGYATAVLPHGSVTVAFRGGNYFFHGGVWFRPVGGRFVVDLPPLGIVLPILPPAYATLWIGGAPYYYANGVYYAAAPGQGYVVVAPPPGADVAQPVPAAQLPAAIPEPILYPRNGQSVEQTVADRKECDRWAMAQPRAQAESQVFQRAVSACMDARAYTVR